MPRIVVVATEGRFKTHLEDAVRRFQGPLPSSGDVEIQLLEQDGSPWLCADTTYTAQAEDLFDIKSSRSYSILDRAADLCARNRWRTTQPPTSFAGWADRQRSQLHKAVITWTLPPTVWDRL